MPPITIEQAMQIAVAHHQAGRLAEAEQLYRQILAQNPQHPGASHYLGLIATRAGQFDVAAALIQKSVAIQPENPQAHCDLGNALFCQGQLDSAVSEYRQAISIKSDHVEAYVNLANVLRFQRLVDQSIAACRRAISLNPNFAPAYGNLAAALIDNRQLDDAIIAARQAIALNPNYVEAYNNLVVALVATGRNEHAAEAAQKAIAIAPQNADLHINLAGALIGTGQFIDAIAAARQAIRIQPGSSQPYTNLGLALFHNAQLDESISAYRQAIALSPNSPSLHSNLVYSLLFHPAYDARTLAQENQRWNLTHAEPLRNLIQIHFNDREPNRRLRIGYVSPDFRNHVVARNMLPLFRHHDRQLFEITCYSQVSAPDATTHQLQQHTDRWRDIASLSDEQVAAQVRTDQIDILVDLSLHLASNRLPIFARKPAPVQITFAGYPGSTGLTTIDCRLSDPYLDPPGMDESIYSGRTLRLPHTFWCYDPLEDGDIPVNSLPALETDVFTFGCLSNFSKVNGFVLTLWANVLQNIQGSRLLLLGRSSHREQAIDHFTRQGIDPARIEFAAPQSRGSYLQLYHRIDLGLDSFPYNGHTTSLESLWMGVPVVTLVGPRVVSRAGWSQLSNLALTELAAQTPEQFITIATGLAKNLPRLAELRSTLRNRMEKSPLMDAPAFARDIESAYRQAWQNWCTTIKAFPYTSG